MAQQNPIKTSVALCTYNGESFIKEQLNSILNQNVPVNEIVICDDCSVDNTWSILEEYKNFFPAVFKLYKNSDNLGFFNNFEKCLSLTTNELVFLSDQDDIWHTDKTEVIINFFINNPEKEVVFTNADLVGQLNTTHKKMWDTLNFDRNKQEAVNNPVNSFAWLIEHGNVATGATMALRNKDKYLPFFKFEHMLHDGYITLIAAACGKLYCIDRCLIDYRQHPQQYLGAQDQPGEKQPDYKKVLQKIKNLSWFYRYSPAYMLNKINLLKDVSGKTNNMYCRSLLKSEELRYKYYNNRFKLVVPFFLGHYKQYGGFMLFVRELLGKNSQKDISGTIK